MSFRLGFYTIFDGEVLYRWIIAYDQGSRSESNYLNSVVKIEVENQ